MASKRWKRPFLTEEELLQELETGTSDIECLSDDADDGDEDVIIRERIQDEEEDSNGENEDSSDDENENRSDEEIETTNDTERDNYEWVTPKKLVKWLENVEYITKDLYCQTSRLSNNEITENYPITYFLKYVPNTLFENIVQYTNMYAIQNGTTSFQPTNLSEMKAFFGLTIIAGTLRFPRLSMYWNRKLKVNVFTETMTLKRFFKLRTHVHCVDNLAPRNSEDKLWKVRPIFDSVLKRCRELDIETNVCVDEQIMPFKGKLSLKQYIKNKPHPWGIKLYMLSGESGLTYNFIIYQGKTTEFQPNLLKKYGQGATAVLHLSEHLKPGKHRLFCDNYFTTYHLLQILNEKGILAAGTIRTDRFCKPPITKKKDFVKKRRGTSELILSTDGIVLVNWLDNKPVTLASNFVGVGKEDTAKRWDKVTKTYVEVKRPEIIQKYNCSMGGTDKADALIAYYRSKSRCKKWTVRMIFHAIDMALINSWLEYKKDAAVLGIAKKDILDLLHFRMHVGESLIKVEQDHNRKRGRPSSLNESSPLTVKRQNVEVRPLDEVRYDNVGHFPEHSGQGLPLRCKNQNCGGKSRWKCTKCKIHLCLQKEKNCFMNFHQK